MRKILAAIVFVALSFSASCANEKITSIEQLNDQHYRVGSDTEGPVLKAVTENLPNAQILKYNTFLDAYLALQNGKIDALTANEQEFFSAKSNGLENVRVLPGYIGTPIPIAAGISDSSKIPNLKEKFNSFIAKIKADGTLEDMYQRWVYDNNMTMPPIDVPKKSDVHLSVGTTGLVMPFSFYINSNVTGLDIELAMRFAAYIGAAVEFKIYGFGSILMAIKSGAADIALSNLYVTQETKESVTLSDTISTINCIAVVRDDGKTGSISQDKAIQNDMAGKTIAVQIGTTCAELVPEKIPSAKLAYYDSLTDELAALRAGKVDAVCSSLPAAIYMTNEDSRLELVRPFLRESELFAIFTSSDKGRKLCEEYSDFLKVLWDNGTIDALNAKWLGADESKKNIEDYSTLPDINGTVTLAVDTSLVPFAYVKDNRITGYDVELAVMFCKSKGYALNVENMSLTGVIASVKSGKSDFTCCMNKTPERSEGTLFASTPSIKSGNVLVIMKSKNIHDSKIIDDAENFLNDLESSFGKTFIREERWKLFEEGIINTIIITVLSIFFGILLGFTAFMMCRKGSALANIITKFSVWLIKGMPIVVLLMILYYVVFGSVNISGMSVSVIAFTLIFATSVYRMLTFGTGAVDRGQTEASYALGFTDMQTFFTVILPQAALHFMPSLREEITMLIKSTSIVGYIAVQDLTKMGDIVRSRTYEAFFPLIAVAVIYFILAGILNIIVTAIEYKITPSRRKPENILRGIRI